MLNLNTTEIEDTNNYKRTYKLLTENSAPFSMRTFLNLSNVLFFSAKWIMNSAVKRRYNLINKKR